MILRVTIGGEVGNRTPVQETSNKSSFTSLDSSF